MTDYSFIANAHPGYIETLYKRYQKDPLSVDESWASFFKGFEYALSQSADTAFAKQAPEHTQAAELPEDEQHIYKELRVFSLILAYRLRAHLLSTTNPIKQRKDRKPHLELENFELSEADLDTPFLAAKEIDMPGPAPLREILQRLHHIYCGNIGFEYYFIQDREKRIWLRTHIEKQRPDDYGLSMEEKRRILEKLNGAVQFEKFLHTKYVGQKRFSLEGGETTIPALDGIINEVAARGAEEVVIGMAHRGRLNVLANIMGKTYEQIFNEFEGTAVPDQRFGDGDVKYHLGFSSQVETPFGKKIHLKLVPNPSHLESVDPVVEGFTRAKGELLYEKDFRRILPILIHGDAALAGQGVVYETVQMSQLDGYFTGGTIHFVINNQIGFTTNFEEARSSTYSTGVAGVVQAPVFHVNGDDPEAVLFVCKMAVEYRQKFQSDVFIDMVCYRKHGHNEGDDPRFTQPEMYKIIAKHPNPRELYVQKLTQRGLLDKALAEQTEKAFWEELQKRFDEVREKPLPYEYQEYEQAWRNLRKTVSPKDFESSPATGIPKARAEELLDKLLHLPKGFTPHGKVNRLLKQKLKLRQAGKLDWAMAEWLAYASLLVEGYDIRISGQDVERGTFSHRHALFFDAQTYKPYNRFSELAKKQGTFRIYNSLLSEFGVLGFEYGYSLATPNTLVIWEAQFGDFVNGAQTIIDQYISAAESKWRRMSGLCMFLPHGYEGQGPEHSNGRMNRFLQLCAEYNMTVANCTEPANFFHLLRRQLHRPFRKPLIVMTPKSLLRHPAVISSLEEFEGKSHFREILDDTLFKTTASAKKVKRVLFCTGKIYYDLLAEREKNGRNDVAIVRLEQLYPFPKKQWNLLLKKYTKAEYVWVQEEPANMGAWSYLLTTLHEDNTPLRRISRKPSASPATGHKKLHDQEQQEIIQKAFA